jgi:2-dehydro-3-deoxy-D-arabinonate dehydratase
VLGYDEEIIGYTCCNDVSAWDIERENPLYLPQSKIFEGCCAIGPVLATRADIPDPRDLGITCRMYRGGSRIYEGYVHSSQIQRSLEEMTGFLCRNNPVPPGTVVSTGTGIMVPNDLPMQEGDRVEIEIEGIGVLANVARRLSS